MVTAPNRYSVVDKGKFFETIGYDPHAKQRLYHRSKARFKVPVCGRRFGKSTMAARDLEPELLLPKRRYWIVGPTYDLAEKEFRVIWDDLIIGQGLGRDKRVRKAYNKKSGDMYIEFPWQTRVEARSAEHPENLVGEGLHGAVMSEAAKHKFDTWEKYIRPSLADYRGWATFPTTPEGQNWLYKLWQYGKNPNPQYVNYEAWRFPSWDNPVLYPLGRQDPEILEIELTTTPEWFEQEIAADFTAFVGKIYGEFQEDVHVRPTPYNPAWPNFMAFDWGFRNFACVEFQVDPWDNIHVWREYRGGYKTVEQHLAIMAQREQPPGYRIEMAYGDAADPAAALSVSTNLVGCLALPEAKENWRQGIDCVKMFLKQFQVGESDEFGTPIYEPKFFIDHNCPTLIFEFNNYRTPEPSRSLRNAQDPRDGAQKKNDH